MNRFDERDEASAVGDELENFMMDMQSMEMDIGTPSSGMLNETHTPHSGPVEGEDDGDGEGALDHLEPCEPPEPSPTPSGVSLDNYFAQFVDVDSQEDDGEFVVEGLSFSLRSSRRDSICNRTRSNLSLHDTSLDDLEASLEVELATDEEEAEEGAREYSRFLLNFDNPIGAEEEEELVADDEDGECSPIPIPDDDFKYDSQDEEEDSEDAEKEESLRVSKKEIADITKDKAQFQQQRLGKLDPCAQLNALTSLQPIRQYEYRMSAEHTEGVRSQITQLCQTLIQVHLLSAENLDQFKDANEKTAQLLAKLVQERNRTRLNQDLPSSLPGRSVITRAAWLTAMPMDTKDLATIDVPILTLWDRSRHTLSSLSDAFKALSSVIDPKLQPTSGLCLPEFSSKQKRQFFKSEDQLLRLGLKRFGNGVSSSNKHATYSQVQWNSIVARFLPGQTLSSTKERYFQLMKSGGFDAVPAVSRERRPLTPEEMNLLIKGVNEFGNQWSKIVKTYFPERNRKFLRRAYVKHCKTGTLQIASSEDTNTRRNEMIMIETPSSPISSGPAVVEAVEVPIPPKPHRRQLPGKAPQPPLFDERVSTIRNNHQKPISFAASGARTFTLGRKGGPFSNVQTHSGLSLDLFADEDSEPRPPLQPRRGSGMHSLLGPEKRPPLQPIQPQLEATPQPNHHHHQQQQPVLEIAEREVSAAPLPEAVDDGDVDDEDLRAIWDHQHDDVPVSVEPDESNICNFNCPLDLDIDLNLGTSSLPLPPHLLPMPLLSSGPLEPIMPSPSTTPADMSWIAAFNGEKSSTPAVPNFSNTRNKREFDRSEDKEIMLAARSHGATVSHWPDSVLTFLQNRSTKDIQRRLSLLLKQLDRRKRRRCNAALQ